MCVLTHDFNFNDFWLIHIFKISHRLLNIVRTFCHHQVRDMILGVLETTIQIMKTSWLIRFIGLKQIVSFTFYTNNKICTKRKYIFQKIGFKVKSITSYSYYSFLCHIIRHVLLHYNIRHITRRTSWIPYFYSQIYIILLSLKSWTTDENLRAMDHRFIRVSGSSWVSIREPSRGDQTQGLWSHARTLNGWGYTGTKRPFDAFKFLMML